jgi:chromosome segregation ATPase
MYASIRHAFAAFCSQQVADLTTELGSLRNQLCSLRKSRDEWRRECQHASARLALAERAHQTAAANVAATEEELALSQSAERTATEQLRAVEARAASQQAELERLRGEVRQAQHELDVSNKQLELACKENELLAKIHQGDLARRERELAIEKRGKTDAELASQMTMFEAGEAGAVANATM